MAADTKLEFISGSDEWAGITLTTVVNLDSPKFLNFENIGADIFKNSDK